MTNPPQGSDEPGNPDPGNPDRYPTQPAPMVGPGAPAPTYGQGPGYGQPPPYGQGQPWQAPPYGPPQGAPASQYGQPGFGQPGFGPPAYGQSQPPYGAAQYGAPGAPAAKSRVGLIALVTGILLVVIAGVVVLVLSLQSTVLDPAAVERDVAAQFQEREGVAVELSCTDDMEVSAGATYECSGTTADGESVTLQIAITDEDAAAYTWTEP